MGKETKPNYQDVIFQDYGRGRFIFYERTNPDTEKEASFKEEAKKLITQEKEETLLHRLQESLAKHQLTGKLSMEEQVNEPKTYKLQLRAPRKVRGNDSLKMEYLSMDGDMDDSINDSMEIQGPLSRETKEYLRRTASQMRQTDSEISRAIEYGQTEQAEFLINQWDSQRTSMLYYLRSSRIRVNPGKKKNKQKLSEKTQVNEIKNERKKGIHRPKSKGLSRERVRYELDNQ